MTELRIKLVKEIINKKRKINEISDILGVSRQSISKWKSQYLLDGEAGIIPKKPGPKKGACWNKTPAWLENEICSIAQDYPFMGPIGIADELEENYGEKKDQSTVYRILKREKIRYYKGYHGNKKKRKLCVYTAIDDASRHVVSKVYTSHRDSSTLDFVEHVISHSKFKVQAFRTDQGREFSRRVTQYLRKLGIEHIKNPPYTPQHNGKVERYHRTMKENCCIYWKFDATIDELNYNLKLWTEHYNCKKKHYRLGMNGLTPEKVLQNFSKINPLIMQNL